MASQENSDLVVVLPPPPLLPPLEDTRVGEGIGVAVSTAATAVGVGSSWVAVGSGVSVAAGWASAVSRFWEATVRATEVPTRLAISTGLWVGAGAGEQAASRIGIRMMVMTACFVVLFMRFSLVDFVTQ